MYFYETIDKKVVSFYHGDAINEVCQLMQYTGNVQ